MEGVKESLQNAPGPMPWYWNDLPEIMGHIWKRDDSGEIHLIAESSQECKLIICMYTRVIVSLPSYIIAWYGKNDRMHIDVLDISDLGSLKSVESGERNSYRKYPYVFHNDSVQSLQIDKSLPEGIYPMAIPQTLEIIPEIFLIGSTRSEKGCYTIFIVNTHDRTVQVLPQKWFTGDAFDIGYEWITKVTRHSETNRLIGTGIRIKDFMLSEDGCYLDRWI